MDKTLLAKQMIDFQKSTFDNAYNAVTMIQDHTERVANTLFEQATWFPEESKRMISQWTDIYKKGRNDLKDAIDDSFDKMTRLFNN